MPLHIVEVQSGSYLGEDDIALEDTTGVKGPYEIDYLLQGIRLTRRIASELNTMWLTVARAMHISLPKRIVVGRDVRVSAASPMRLRGLDDSGVDVYDVGVCGTEGVYFATFQGRYDGGIMITAKPQSARLQWHEIACASYSKPISGDNGLQTFADFERGEFRASADGVRQRIDTRMPMWRTCCPTRCAKAQALNIVGNAATRGV